MRISTPIIIKTFPGMNNVAQRQGRTEDFVRNTIIPQIILNMYVTPDGKLIIRQGSALLVALEDTHSLTSDGIDLFCAGKGTISPESIWKVSTTGTKTEISAINGKLNPISYIFVNNKGYMSSKVWNGVYEYSTDAIRGWGSTYGDDVVMIDNLVSSEEMLTLNVKPAPYMENLCLWGSRIWGSIGNVLHYSEPLAFEWFRNENTIPFLQDITMVAEGNNGLYVSSDSLTWFMSGMNPEEMTMKIVGDGSVPGSLQYCDFAKFGDGTPVWTSKSGIVAGVAGGIKPLTSGRIRFDINGRASSLFSNKGGVPQYLSSFGLPSTATFGDSVTTEVVRNGKLI